MSHQTSYINKAINVENNKGVKRKIVDAVKSTIKKFA